jgi:F-type H+-transporting ATPase subunit epsilon
MPALFHVELVTPERVLYSGDVEEVSMRTDTGEIAFLARHEDFIGASDITVVAIHTGDQESSKGDTHGEESRNVVRAAVHGGFVRVDSDGVLILAGVAELGTQINVARARAALARAEESSGTTVHEAAGREEEISAEQRALEAGGAAAALLASDVPEVAARRARARLDAAGASTTSS